MDMLKGNFLINTKEEAVIANEILRDNEYIGLYFSASWCPPCQIFLPQLRDVYEKARQRTISLEIIFIPADKDNQRMTRFFVDNHGPWYALPVGPLTAALRKKLQVYSIPCFIVLSNKGTIISKNGRENIEDLEDPLAHWFGALSVENENKV
ncbi:nucleoredoxin-like protein 2 [Phymastichus coffea]|uniref:nucleoredoxin-like protein 2 n=1 Tax=Phymastichus coffea TaxID=108790 RepID=UPI00273AE2D4|nr:nucleoredoxin-like protein 2 [Phymastichus coffea]